MLIPAHAPDAPPAAASAGSRFFTGPGLLVFLGAALTGYEAFLLLTIFGPTGEGALGGFVRDFQQWCYQGDPRTGGMSWAAVSIMLLEPVMVVLVAGVLWRDTVVQLRSPALWLRHLRAAAAGLVVVAAAVAGLVGYAQSDRAGGAVLPPFPGERIRVQLAVPDKPLVDQKGTPFRLADLRGQVVLVTGVYASCSTACPEVFKELRAVLGELPAADRAGLHVVALSLNPEYETAEIMDAMAGAQGLAFPEFRYVNGERPDEMRDLLKSLQFSVTRDPETGVLNHANLFLLIDREGRIAFRFTLDPRHRAWLREGLLHLLRE
ncbi:SCO family protein [Oleiharenicola lentus]|uniref:SCO family protein n=1 Tax=Oleiharenicola lentus TaxID=2508720 RepID=A0A4Q1C8C0_9BACT|nr:SCO family protein [Oleiharenicola lentus]RXK55184.1 SCO family protein [Oleiharenicola lentus]